MIERTHSAQIDIDPFLARPRALPRAGEVIGSACLHATILIEQSHFADQPGCRAGSRERHAIETAVRRRSQCNGRFEFARRTVRAGHPAQFLPCLPVVRTLDQRAPAGLSGLSHPHARVDVHAIHLARTLAARQLDLYPSAGALQVHARQPVVIQQPFALVLFEFALLARGDYYPTR